MLEIVPVSHIPPKDKITEVPLDDPMAIYKVAAQMEICCRNYGGIGLSAVQVGIPWKMFIADIGGEFRCYVNTTYTGLGKKELSVEGCLSLRSQAGLSELYKVQRFESVELNGFELCHRNLAKPVFSDVKELVDGRIAVVFQHEIDHSDGILISDIGERVHLWK